MLSWKSNIVHRQRYSWAVNGFIDPHVKSVNSPFQFNRYKEYNGTFRLIFCIHFYQGKQLIGKIVNVRA